MVSRISQCDRRQLELAIENRLADAQAEELSRHLQSCAHCQADLEQLAGSPGSWSEVKTYLNSLDALIASDDSGGIARTVPTALKLDAISDRPDEISLEFLAPSDIPGMLGRLGSYEIEEVIGSGGMGVVLKARDSLLNRVVAIKVMAGYSANSAAARRRFAREAQAAAAVVHDHVIPIYAVDPSGRTPFLVMPFVSGRSLQERLNRCGLLDVKEVLRIALQTAQGLAAAHAQGLIHRDIKPANILLENGVERVRITDFGLARASDDASQTQSGFIAGTPQYMSPEQARGESIDARADLFSLGSVMYAMCSGHPPFRAETTFAVLRRVCDDTPRDLCEVNPDVPRWLARIVAKLHAKLPADRFQSADEVAVLLEKWLAHLQQPTVIAPPESPDPGRVGRRRKQLRRAAMVVAGVAVAAAMTVMVVEFWPAGPELAPQRPEVHADVGSASASTAPGGVAQANRGSSVVRSAVVLQPELQSELEKTWRETVGLGLKVSPDSSVPGAQLQKELWELSGQLESLERELQRSVPAAGAKLKSE